MTADFSRTLTDGSAAFAPFLEAIEVYLESQGIPQGATARLMVVFDDVISNILSHGGGEGGKPRVDVRIRINTGSVDVEICDNAIGFNPLELEAPDTGLSIDQRAVGGLGIHLVRELMDDLKYERTNGNNILQLRLNLP